MIFESYFSSVYSGSLLHVTRVVSTHANPSFFFFFRKNLENPRSVSRVTPLPARLIVVAAGSELTNSLPVTTIRRRDYYPLLLPPRRLLSVTTAARRSPPRNHPSYLHRLCRYFVRCERLSVSHLLFIEIGAGALPNSI